MFPKNIKFYQSPNYINDNVLNEGLIKSYNINDCKKYLNDELRFPAIQRIFVYSINPYYEEDKPSSDSFAGIVLNPSLENLEKYQEIAQTCYNLLGWFVGYITVSVKLPSGHQAISFCRGERYAINNKEQDCFFYKNIEFNQFIHSQIYKDKIVYAEMTIEEKYPINEYLYDNDEIFYHVTERKYIDKIFKNGLIPKTKYNYPDRIYLSNDLEDLRLMMRDKQVKDPICLKIKLQRKQRLYMDPRRDNSVFTYDNISPKEIEILDNIDI